MFASCEPGCVAAKFATHARTFGPTAVKNERKRPEVISYLSRRLLVSDGSTSDLQQLSCDAPASPVSPLPHVRMPAVSAVAHERSVHFPVPAEQPPVAQSAPAAHARSTRQRGAR